ncbi:TetR/AcrR family transcriptional regulator [Lentzea sp. NBRC 102530]|uniref:TetR/AcrR family transcriptional regulator n=1 Tax=Lentzea sp. NBRC 102530 TaxID=3032201 RepID=UPI0024A3C1EA|nr:TetR/AcrR family transcriptional regulator [Lentzea sp. NBRC 102530]GLY48296.1 TetR family transcriptional regulator [Lentzea sp. NBRC 102530]
MPTKVAPDPTRRSDSSRRAILTAALALVSEIGYPNVTMVAIAKAAGVGKQTIYRWWPTKGELLFDAFLSLAGDGGAASLPDTGDLATDLKAVLDATVDELNDPGLDQAMRAMHTEVVHDQDLAADYATRLDGPMRALKKARLAAAQEAGQIADDVDLDVAVDLIWGPILTRWLHRTEPLTSDYAHRVVDTALRGLTPRA